MSGGATEVPRQKFELTDQPQPVGRHWATSARSSPCVSLSGAELDLDLLGELERHLRALSDRFMRSPLLRVGFDHAEQAVSFIGYPGCEIEAFINEEQSP